MIYLKPAVALLVLATLAAQISEPPQLSVIREKVLENSERMPRYTCVESISRKRYRPRYSTKPNACPALIAERAKLTSAGQLIWQDRLKLDVAVGSNSEIFSWAGAREFETTNIQELISNGASGSGDFSSFAHNIFKGGADQFQYKGEQASPSGRLHWFTYKVPFSTSSYQFSVPGEAPRIIAYKGEFFARASDGELQRLTISADEFPPGEVCSLSQSMDYQRIRIGTSEFTLPSLTTMTALYLSGEEARNETRFSNCHEYVGESTISFGDPGETSATVAISAATKLPPLPKDLRLRLSMDQPINTETASAGDMITAVVTREIKQGNQVLIKQGDKLRGRLIRAEQHLAPTTRWVLMLKFDTIERNGIEQSIELEPIDDGDRKDTYSEPVGLAPRSAPAKVTITHYLQRPQGAGVYVFYKSGNITLDKEFRTEWKTR